MAFNCIEGPRQQASVERNKYTSRREYVFSGSLEKIDALKTIALASSATDPCVDINGTLIQLFKRKVDVKEAGGGVWSGTVDYDNTPDQFDMKINNGVQTTKMLQALETIAVYDAITGDVVTGNGVGTANVPDFKNALGVKGDGLSMEVEGLDVEIGKMEFSLTRKMADASLSAGYEAYLATVTPSVNNALWTFVYRGQLFAFPRGSVLFRGHTTNDSSTNLEITHNFAYSRGIGKAADAWSNAVTYHGSDQVTYNGHLWQNEVTDNLNHTPGNGYPIYFFSETYAFGAKVILGNHEYESLIANNTQHLITDTAAWQDNGLLAHWLDLGTSGEQYIGLAGPIVKEGWEYAEPWYKPTVATGITIPSPTGLRILRVHYYSDFGALQCGF